MSDDVFDRGWLTLREPADHRARAHRLTGILAEEGERRGWSHVLDLGAGTGSNLRYLSGRLDWAREWTLVDHDASLLGFAEQTSRQPVRTVVGDLAHEGIEAVAEAHVVSASALLDLVSHDWLEALASACALSRAGVLFALSYDGTVTWSDQDDDDERIREALNEHQRREKGLGAALGPDATDAASRLFRAAGYETTVEESPWLLEGARDRDLTLALMRGWIDAASEMRPADADTFEAWGRRRGEQVVAGSYGVRVGHHDLLALPA